MNRPEYIGRADWELLLEKHDGLLPKEIINKLNNKYPIQYLIGYVEFLDLKLMVNENVLIPRYETELMVDKTIKLIQKQEINPASIIDLGCGSGAIAISLAKKFNTKVDALDMSEKALKITNLNAQNNKASLNLIQKDILKDDICLNHSLIISNPPYVDINEIVDPQTKYEPQNAIFAGENGLIFYKRIVELAKQNLQREFTLVFEIGCTQKDDICEIILNQFPNAKIQCEKDFSDRNRYIFANIINFE